ncbi:hypothetical protein ACJX0J_007047, partial [Zea mays]
ILRYLKGTSHFGLLFDKNLLKESDRNISSSAICLTKNDITTSFMIFLSNTNFIDLTAASRQNESNNYEEASSIHDFIFHLLPWKLDNMNKKGTAIAQYGSGVTLFTSTWTKNMQ